MNIGKVKKILPIFFIFCLMIQSSGCAGAASVNPSMDVPDQADEYLTYIGNNLKNRNIHADGGTEVNQHDEACQWIVSEIKKAGYAESQIQLQNFSAIGNDSVNYSGTNVILTLQGADEKHQVIIGAHYDGDGCGDNGSGIALLLAEAAGLKGKQPGQNVRIIFFDGEEKGELGAGAYVKSMTEAEIASTEYMVNIDSVAFGDYCNLYGGVQNDTLKKVEKTEAYEEAVEKAKTLGMKAYTTKDLDGYYAAHGAGPAIEENAVYTNPWTYDNPAPENAYTMSPSTGDWGDHLPFKEAGIPYVYMEATNWYAAGDGGSDAYTGYFETGDASLGYSGMFMNTDADTLENLNKLFPGRASEHFQIFSKILSAMIAG